MIRVETRIGMAGWEDHRFRGHGVYAELQGCTSLSQLLALALGLEVGPEDGVLLDELAVCAALADPHVWPLKITRTAGAYGDSPITGLAAGLLATDGPLLGAGSVRGGAAWLHQLVASKAASVSVQASVREALVAGKRLPGFGVPVRKVDERVSAITRCIVTRGRDKLPHWSMWTHIVEETRRHEVEPNAGSAFAAALLDLGFPPHLVHVVVHLFTLACFLANAVEGAEQHLECFRSIPSEYLVYEGPTRRASPRALAANRG